MAGGDTMVVIYQKMMLSSLDTSGVIYYEGIYGKLEEELALMIDEEVEQVAMTLSYFTKAGLIQIDDNQNVEMSQVSALIDQETNWARYKREQRKSNKLDNVQSLSNERPTEIELEKEIEIKKETKLEKDVDVEDEKAKEDDNAKAYESLVSLFEENGFGTIGGLVSTDISNELKDFAEANNDDYREAYKVILLAIKLAVSNGACKFSYVWSITKGWYQKKLFTVKDIEASEQKRKDEKSKQSRNSFNRRPQKQEPEKAVISESEQVRSYSDDEYQKAMEKLKNLKTKAE